MITSFKKEMHYQRAAGAHARMACEHIVIRAHLDRGA
jgi:hypothetical protein